MRERSLVCHTIHYHPSVLQAWLTSLQVKYVDEGDGDEGKQGIQEEGVISEMKGGKWEGQRKKGGEREREKRKFYGSQMKKGAESPTVFPSRSMLHVGGRGGGGSSPECRNAACSQLDEQLHLLLSQSDERLHQSRFCPLSFLSRSLPLSLPLLPDKLPATLNLSTQGYTECTCELSMIPKRKFLPELAEVASKMHQPHRLLFASIS